MTGRLIDLAVGLNRRQRVTIELDQDFREEFHKLKDAQLDVKIKKYRKQRSLDANAYAWVLIGKLAAALGHSPDEVYRASIRDVGDNYEIVPVRENRIEHWDRIWCAGHIGRFTEDLGPCRNTMGYHNIRSYIGSSDYDTAQMSRLIDNIVRDCKDLEIETMTPRKLSLLKEQWGQAEQREEDKKC